MFEAFWPIILTIMNLRVELANSSKCPQLLWIMMGMRSLTERDVVNGNVMRVLVEERLRFFGLVRANIFTCDDAF